MTMFTSWMVTLAVAFCVAVMVIVLEVVSVDWVITGALSSTASLVPWVTVCPVSVAFTVTLPWARSYSAAKADTGMPHTSSSAMARDMIRFFIVFSLLSVWPVFPRPWVFS